MQRDNPARRIDKRLWLSLGVFASLIVLHQCLIQPSLIQMTSDAPVINIAGRQRMLSQKLTKEALAFVNADSVAARQRYQAELKSTIETWTKAHASLRANHSTVDQATASLDEGYQSIERHFQSMASAAQALADGSSESPDRGELDVLLRNEPEFLTQMNALVGIYESEARQHVWQLQMLGMTIMIIILATLLAFQFAVMRPELSIAGQKWEQIESRYQLLVESMTDGIVVFNRQGQIEFANRRFSNLLGVDPQRVVGQAASPYLSDLDRKQFEHLLAARDESAGPIDMKLHSATGREVDVMVSPRRLIDRHGHFEGLLLVVTDVTTRKAIEQRSQQLQIQLAHADRLKSMGAMAAALAHEINQPLGAISNYAEGILARLTGTTQDPQDLVVPLRGILRAAHRGGEIVRRTRNFARRRPYQADLASMNELVIEVAELCRPEARRRGVTIELSLADELPMLTVDGIQIQQVLTNLIGNAFVALEQSQNRPPWIRLSTCRSSDDSVEVTVADSGPGLPGDQAQSLFEPFVTTEQNGTGLGLAIAHGIIEAHGGHIWTDLSADSGAVFKFTLPLTPPWQHQTESLAEDEESPGDAEADLLPAMAKPRLQAMTPYLPVETRSSDRTSSVPRAI